MRSATWTRADTVLSEGSQVAAQAGATAVQARIRVLLADVRSLLSGGFAEALAECEQAAAVLESDGDLEGLAEALTVAGKLRFWTGDIAGSGRFWSAPSPARGKAATIARRCGPATGWP